MASDSIRIPAPEALGFDPSALREKYRVEADKRRRADGESQFIEITNDGKYASYLLSDPWATPDNREPFRGDVEVLIIGGGWAGLLSAARVIQAGISDVRIIDAGADFGGTWYWNRYPGAQCDIESYIYLPLLEETGYIPKEKYSYAPEIYEHAQRIAKHFGLYENACFQTLVEEMRWDEVEQRWIVRTNRGDRFRAHFVITGTGPANRPRLPGIPGIEEFQGHAFHTSRWDYDYTGGGPDGNLHKLADKRVAIIGTGATAVQCVSAVGESAKQLYVFQRTPSSVDLRGNSPTDPEWVKTLKPGWQRERQQNFNNARRGPGPIGEDLVNDGWTKMRHNLESLLSGARVEELDPETAAAMAELADLQTMSEIRRRVDQTVQDPAVADRLKAWYGQMCKRPTFNDEYLPTFNRPNVELIDVSGSRGVDRISRKGVVANGVEYEVDCIIYASGFEITSDFHRRIGFEIFGEDGQSLYDAWRDGEKTLHGHSTSGFPNWFLVGGIFAFSLGINYCSVVDDQARHVAYIIAEAERRNVRRVEATAEAQTAWMDAVHGSAYSAVGGQQCTPGYYNNEGVYTPGRTISEEFYSAGADSFARLLASWRERGDLQGMALS